MSEQEKILRDITFGYHGEPGQWQDGEHGPWRDNPPYTEELTAAYVNAIEAENARYEQALREIAGLPLAPVIEAVQIARAALEEATDE